jgi:DNA-binding response OmpR family regulator
MASKTSVAPDTETSQRALRVLLYSSIQPTRAAVREALGRRPAADLPEFDWVECATLPAVLEQADSGSLDLLILDGEASPMGGLGLCRQLKDEIFECPPVLVLTARPQDAWLATWSKADGVSVQPIDPFALARTVAELVRLGQR